jgi:hypothetical protein
MNTLRNMLHCMTLAYDRRVQVLERRTRFRSQKGALDLMAQSREYRNSDSVLSDKLGSRQARLTCTSPVPSIRPACRTICPAIYTPNATARVVEVVAPPTTANTETIRSAWIELREGRPSRLAPKSKSGSVPRKSRINSLAPSGLLRKGEHGYCNRIGLERGKSRSLASRSSLSSGLTSELTLSNNPASRRFYASWSEPDDRPRTKGSRIDRNSNPVIL